jgi:hypothetical protein
VYVDHTLKSIQSSKNKKSLESINSNHKKINLMKIQKKKKKQHQRLYIDQILTSKETLVNLMTQQVMILLT